MVYSFFQYIDNRVQQTVLTAGREMYNDIAGQSGLSQLRPVSLTGTAGAMYITGTGTTGTQKILREQ
jgi:hypothetical protein